MSVTRHLWPTLLAVIAFFCLIHETVEARPPHLYGRAGYQGPTRGAPDDLLMIAGDALAADDVVVYRSYDPSEPAEHPETLPDDAGPLTGIAPVVSAVGAPFQLIVRFPQVMLEHHPYRLWAVTKNGEWSNGITINDSRPMWISPAEIYSTAKIANLPRYLKVIGRNLLPINGRLPAVRLVGARRYEMRGVPSISPDVEAVDASYVVIGLLPTHLEAGMYRVEVQTGQTTWAAVSEQLLTVRPDPTHASEFNISDDRFGHCRPDDGQDDTECVSKALAAARTAGGGRVVFERGTWNLSSGLVVPTDVQLVGRGAAVTRLVRSRMSPQGAEFILLGHNLVSDLSFVDQQISTAGDDRRPVLQLGRKFSTDTDPRAVPIIISEVAITRNVFDKTDGAIVDAGSAIERLYVTYNEFGDYRLAIDLGGNRFNVKSRFGITDSVIAHNHFSPGSYLDLERGQGTIASELGASRRVDFSSNVADGADRRFLYSTADAAGWRAAFFWHMNGNHEMLLISGNKITCSGDKDGDGEAIALDSNANTYGLSTAQVVLRSTADSATVAGPLKPTQNSRPVNVDTYYVGHWLRIDEGPGIGQSRRIVAIQRSPSPAEVTFHIEPPWDVAPEAHLSQVSVAREYWQVMVLNNTVDQRTPLCLKSNRTRPKGGNISMWGQSADSVIDGNRQYDTDGIVFEQRYGGDDPACPDCRASTEMPSFLEIRNNTIEGEYDWDSACSLSGIMGSYSAAPSPHAPPPLLSFGVSVSHNRVTHADSLHGGAIGIVPTWFSGPPGWAKPLLRGLIIDHNLIQSVSGLLPRPACGYKQSGRFGIDLQGADRYIDGTVLYRNVCEEVTIPLRDHGVHTKRLCDPHDAKTCECTIGH